MVFWTDVSCTPPNESLILRKLKLGFRIYIYIEVHFFKYSEVSENPIYFKHFGIETF